MMRARDFRERARYALSGHWASAVGTTLVASILGADVTMSGGGIFSGAVSSRNISDNNMHIQERFGGVSPAVLLTLAAIFVTMAMVVMIIAVVQFIIGGFVSLGLIQYNLNLIDGKEASIGQIFSKSSMLGKALWLRIRIAIFTFLWTLLFIIPGIIKSFSYSMAGYIMAENPEMTAKEAMEVSMKMMDGNKWRLFCLNLSFIGWTFLGVITCGIALLWVYPYINAAFTAFYDEVSRYNIGA